MLTDEGQTPDDRRRTDKSGSEKLTLSLWLRWAKNLHVLTSAFSISSRFSTNNCSDDLSFSNSRWHLVNKMALKLTNSPCFGFWWHFRHRQAATHIGVGNTEVRFTYGLGGKQKKDVITSVNLYSVFYYIMEISLRKQGQDRGTIILCFSKLSHFPRDLQNFNLPSWDMLFILLGKRLQMNNFWVFVLNVADIISFYGPVKIAEIMTSQSLNLVSGQDKVVNRCKVHIHFQVTNIFYSWCLDQQKGKNDCSNCGIICPP